MYTENQIVEYLGHIGCSGLLDGQDSPYGLDVLANIQKHQLATVPFEDASLHYSKTRLLSLDPEDLFQKIVVNNRGGYCMEVNTFFREVLLSLNFKLFSAGGRVKTPFGYKGWTHMVNIVMIDGARYLVDVAFGSNSPWKPIPLEDGIEFDGVISPSRGRLEYKALDTHSDPSQRVWVYSVRDREDGPWKEQYCFVETEYFPADFEVMNLSTMTSPQSLFVKTVVASRISLDETGEPVAKITLNHDYLRIRKQGGGDVMRKLDTEEERVAALKEHFDVNLAPHEQRAISGLASELKHKVAGADF